MILLKIDREKSSSSEPAMAPMHVQASVVDATLVLIVKGKEGDCEKRIGEVVGLNV